MAEHTYVIGTKEFSSLKQARKYAQDYANEDDRPITITHEIRKTDKYTKTRGRVLGYSAASMGYGKDIVVYPKVKKNPSIETDWIPVHAIRKLPDGSIQLLTEKGTLSNPSKRRSFMGKVRRLFSKNPSSRSKMKTWDIYWGPTGQKIATVEASTAKAAKRKTPPPYKKYKGEVYVQQVG